MKTRKSWLIRGRDRGVRCTGLFLTALWLDLDQPPSTWISAPLMKLAASEARKAAVGERVSRVPAANASPKATGRIDGDPLLAGVIAGLAGNDRLISIAVARIGFI